MRKRMQKPLPQQPEGHKHPQASRAYYLQNKLGEATTPSRWVKAGDGWAPLGSKKVLVPFIASNISHQEAAP